MLGSGLPLLSLKASQHSDVRPTHISDQALTKMAHPLRRVHPHFPTTLVPSKFEHERAKKARSLPSMQTHAKPLVAMLGHVWVLDLTPAQVERYIVEMQRAPVARGEQPYAPGSIAYQCKLLRMALTSPRSATGSVGCRTSPVRPSTTFARASCRSKTWTASWRRCRCAMPTSRGCSI